MKNLLKLLFFTCQLIYTNGFWDYIFRIERCKDYWVPMDIASLRDLWRKNVYGQPLAFDIVPNAISGHFEGNQKKALVLSFHGWPGLGKNYVVKQIVQSMYRKGEKSSFFAYFNARTDFPDDGLIPIYKDMLRKKIERTLWSCGKSIFVFDEVDMMPYKLLDVIHPYIDYRENVNGVDPRKAIFIFLSNRGGTDISEKYLEYWKIGIERDNLTPKDLRKFTNLVRTAAFNEDGGLQHCDNIKSHLISYYIPFLPLERSHIMKCIQKELQNNKIKQNEEIIQLALSQVPFTPQDSVSYGLFATAGCKNVDIFVKAANERLMYRKRKRNEL